MSHPAITMMWGALTFMDSMEPEGVTSFSRLSQEAQDAIVNAFLGEYDDGPPDLSDEVKEEIRLWALEPCEGDEGYEPHNNDNGNSDR